MCKQYLFFLIIVIFSLFTQPIVIAQEFPIANGAENSSCSGAAYDGTNYLIGIVGDTSNSYSITAQFISATGVLIGSRISLGRTGSNELVAFDGSNYLIVWNDPDSVIYGQFINTSGSLVKTPFIIADNATINNKGGCMAFGDTTYMVVWRRNDVHYGQRVSKSGNLVGAPTQISFSPARDNNICFDGTNYLVVWRSAGSNDINIMGQLISKSGVLVGSNFTIDGPYSNDNPVSVAYDGSKYLVAYGDHTTINGPLNIFARFVTTSGSVAIDRINISTKTSVFPTIIFDGTNYFISWTDNVFTSASLVMGRFINTSGVPIDTGFTIFGSLGDKIAAYGISKIGNNKILVVATRVDTPSFSNGDVYGRFINSSSTGVNDNGKNAVPGKYSLGQNYPNPFNPNTTINYSLPKTGNVNVTVYNALGSKIATIVNEYKPAGNYSVQFNGSNIASGIYLYRLESGNFSATKKFILLK